MSEAMDNDIFETESHLVTKLSNLLSQCIIPLYANEEDGKPRLVGSSFLVSSDTNFYLISAAHVFDEQVKKGYELFYYIDCSTTQKLSGNLRITKTPSGKDRKHDHLDIGVLKLDGPALPPYPDIQKYPLPIHLLTPNTLPREDKQYLLVGFPETKNRARRVDRNLVPVPYSFRNISAPSSKYLELCVTPQSHIVLSFSIKHTVGPDKIVRPFPDPLGMSGSPVWLLYDKIGSNDPTQTPVVGIAIEHHKTKHAIVVADIDIALKLINDDA